MRNVLTGIEIVEKSETTELSQATGLPLQQLEVDREGLEHDPLTGQYIEKSESDKPRWPSLLEEPDIEKGEKFECFAPFIKADTERQIIHAVVYEPDVEDSQGDSASAAEIELAAHRFMKECRTVKIMHKGKARKDIDILESYICPEETTIGKQKVTKGTWIIVLKINDKKLWKACKDGTYTGLSMAGVARSEAA